jgi:hypothetical protein
MADIRRMIDMSVIDEEDFDREPTDEELRAIEAESDSLFADPDWKADEEVNVGDYLGAEYDYDTGDPHDYYDQ